jgi:DNA polymerase III subunit epsilon
VHVELWNLRFVIQSTLSPNRLIRTMTALAVLSPRLAYLAALHTQGAHVLADTVIVLDFETTGLECGEGNRVTEVAALRIRDGRIVATFTSLVDCGRRIPAHITAFTGITQAMVDGAPAAAGVFRELLEFIGLDPVIAHNAWFDQGFLASECRRLGIEAALPEFICSYKIARSALPGLPSYALGCLASRLRLPFTAGLHRALVDAGIVANVILRICEHLRTDSSPSMDLAALRRLATDDELITEASAA